MEKVGKLSEAMENVVRDAVRRDVRVDEEDGRRGWVVSGRANTVVALITRGLVTVREHGQYWLTDAGREVRVDLLINAREAAIEADNARMRAGLYDEESDEVTSVEPVTAGTSDTLALLTAIVDVLGERESLPGGDAVPAFSTRGKRKIIRRGWRR